MNNQFEKTPEQVRAIVREGYAQVAKGNAGCCGGNPCNATTLGYSAEDTAAIPDQANLGVGCGNPVAIATLTPGQWVLDLGSGGGMDAFLAAKQVGPNGRVFGVDMTPEMIGLARRNAAQVGATNVDFRLGEIEHLPIDNNTIDVIISNCVINLSPAKAQVFAEAFRVLKPGGLLAISDVVELTPMPDALKSEAEAIAGCVAGAISPAEVRRLLTAAGFTDIDVAVKPNSAEIVNAWHPLASTYVGSANIAARKPVKAQTKGACCAPGCCD